MPRTSETGHPLAGVDITPFSSETSVGGYYDVFERKRPDPAYCVRMAPLDFLRLAAPFSDDRHIKEDPRGHIQEYAEAMRKPGAAFPIPYLLVVGCIVEAHDGRHRAAAAHRLGIASIPVLIVANIGSTVRPAPRLELCQEGTHEGVVIRVEWLWP